MKVVQWNSIHNRVIRQFTFTAQFAILSPSSSAPIMTVRIAVSTSWRHFERSCARIHAVLRPTLWGWRSSSIVQSHVRLGQPARRRQSARGWLMAARRMREWSCDGSPLARCPNRRSAMISSRLVFPTCWLARRHHPHNLNPHRSPRPQIHQENLYGQHGSWSNPWFQKKFRNYNTALSNSRGGLKPWRYFSIDSDATVVVAVGL